MSMLEIPEGKQGFAGRVFGRKVGSPADANSVGTIGPIHGTRWEATAARFWPRADLADFEPYGEHLADKATGNLYTIALDNPLLQDKPAEAGITAYLADPDGGLIFLRPLGHSIADLEAAEKHAATQSAAAEKERTDWLKSQPQVPMVASQFAGRTIRDAARAIIESGGTIGRGTFGELSITLPGRIVRPDDSGWSALSEQEARRRCAEAAELLVHAAPVVLAAIDKQSAKKGNLVELIPDRAPTLGGGAA